MTITPTPEQERILVEAIESGLIDSAEAALNLALDGLRGSLDAMRRERLADETAPLTDAEWLEEFNAWTSGHSTSAPLLSDEAVSREFIYSERGS